MPLFDLCKWEIPFCASQHVQAWFVIVWNSETVLHTFTKKNIWPLINEWQAWYKGWRMVSEDRYSEICTSGPSCAATHKKWLILVWPKSVIIFTVVVKIKGYSRKEGRGNGLCYLTAVGFIKAIIWVTVCTLTWCWCMWVTQQCKQPSCDSHYNCLKVNESTGFESSLTFFQAPSPDSDC